MSPELKPETVATAEASVGASEAAASNLSGSAGPVLATDALKLTYGGNVSPTQTMLDPQSGPTRFAGFIDDLDNFWGVGWSKSPENVQEAVDLLWSGVQNVQDGSSLVSNALSARGLATNQPEGLDLVAAGLSDRQAMSSFVGDGTSISAASPVTLWSSMISTAVYEYTNVSPIQDASTPFGLAKPLALVDGLFRGAVDYWNPDYSTIGTEQYRASYNASHPFYQQIPSHDFMNSMRTAALEGALTAPLGPEGAVEGDVVTLYRVDDAAFAPRILDDGSIPMVTTRSGGERALFVNLGQPERAAEFALVNRGGNATITAVDVDASLLEQLRTTSVLDTSPEAALNPSAPLRVDVNKAPDQFGLRTSEQIQMLRDAIRPGTARIVDPFLLGK